MVVRPKRGAKPLPLGGNLIIAQRKEFVNTMRKTWIIIAVTLAVISACTEPNIFLRIACALCAAVLLADIVKTLWRWKNVRD